MVCACLDITKFLFMGGIRLVTVLHSWEQSDKHFSLTGLVDLNIIWQVVWKPPKLGNHMTWQM
jgi:hypothetical protein